MSISGDLHPLVRLALAMYIGQHCKYCDKEYTSVEELRKLKVVRADGEEFRIACKSCYDLRGNG